MRFKHFWKSAPGIGGRSGDFLAVVALGFLFFSFLVLGMISRSGCITGTRSPLGGELIYAIRAPDGPGNTTFPSVLARPPRSGGPPPPDKDSRKRVRANYTRLDPQFGSHSSITAALRHGNRI